MNGCEPNDRRFGYVLKSRALDTRHVIYNPDLVSKPWPEMKMALNLIYLPFTTG